MIMIKYMSTDEVKMELEKLMNKYGVMDLYVFKWNTTPFDLARGIAIYTDGNYVNFTKDVMTTFENEDIDSYPFVGKIPPAGDARRDELLLMLKQIYDKGVYTDVCSCKDSSTAK